MTDVERAVAALRECADALEALPASLRLTRLTGPVNLPGYMRQEADWLETIAHSLAEHVR